MVLSFFPQVGEEAIEDRWHRQERGAEVPAKAVDPSLRNFSADGGVFFEKSHASARLAQAQGGGQATDSPADDDG
jgi:hypothetical protein